MYMYVYINGFTLLQNKLSLSLSLSLGHSEEQISYGASQIMPTASAIYQVDHSVDLPSYPDTKVIKTIELTVLFETYIEKQHTFKTKKYATLIQDIEDKQISSELTCVEVG